MGILNELDNYIDITPTKKLRGEIKNTGVQDNKALYKITFHDGMYGTDGKPIGMEFLSNIDLKNGGFSVTTDYSSSKSFKSKSAAENAVKLIRKIDKEYARDAVIRAYV